MAIDPDILAAFSDLSGLSETDRRMMAATLTENRFRAGAQLCAEGDASDACWFLVEGEVEVIKALPDGRRVHLATLGAGVTLGQSGLLEGQTRTAEVKAATDVVYLSLTGKSLRWALSMGQEWAVAVQAVVAINLVRQLRTALGRLSELAEATDASEEVTGRSRDQIVQPKSVSVDFSKVRAKQAAAAAEKAALQSEIAAEVAAYDDGAGLMNLLRDTEASLAGQGYGLEDVRFVQDEDMRRNAEARRRKH